jgi:DHA3 family tetracycline resistance protein-like MFS transporter
MFHSHEALDRPGGHAGGGILAPLREREFRLLWSGMCVSLLGDGAFLVALAWQVYALSDAATAMSLVGIAMTVPTIVFLLIGGVASDRFDRRRIMLAADLLRGLAVGLLALLALTGALALWHIVALVVLYGSGAAFFAPAFDAIVPELLPEQRLGQANALDQLVRPIALRLAGPAIGGVVVGAFGAGTAFALDAATFLVSAAALLAMRPRAARPAGAAPAGRSLRTDLREGWRFVRRRAWLWATFASAAVAYLLFMGPVEVLLPLVVKHELHGGAADLGLVFAAGGLGSVACAVALGQRGMPRRDITFMYVAWTLATLAVAGYGLATSIWQLMLACLVFNGLETAGTIVWATAKQRHVPAAMLGRVSSLDWLISIGLLPLSFALTGPVSAAIGVRATLVWAGLLGAAVTFGALFIRGVRSVEGTRPAQAHARASVGEPNAVVASSGG